LGTGIVQDGQGGTDSLAGIERIWGGSFNDSMLGGSGNDFFVGSTGADTFDGGLGDDAVSYLSYPSASSSPTQGVSVDLATGTARDAFGGLDRLVGIEIIEGSSFADTITGGTGNEIIFGIGGADSLSGGAGNDQVYASGASNMLGGEGNDQLFGSNGADTILGGNGNDNLSGGDGNDTLVGGAGTDVAIYSDARTAYRFSLDNGALVVTGPTGTDRLQGIESLRFGSDAPIEVSSLGSMNLVEEMVAVSRGGVTTAVLAERYSGPVSWLEYQVLGIDGGDVMSGTSRNDFFNLLGGDDAANGGGGDDVLDGGSGSNFLTGGAGRDDFFLDGRGGTITWATITDWQANERLSVWGWRPGVSTVQWVDSAGAIGYTGVTMHGDLDGNGVIDTSVTWTGMTAAQLPTPLEYEGLLWFI
jgi:Ca2+-binding RTX toxin-like protein